MIKRIEFQDTGNQYEASGLIPVGDKILDLINIFDEGYLTQLNLMKADPSDPSDILDKIGSLFGLKRNFSVQVNGNTIELNLNDEDFLLLIKCFIIKNNCDGSREQLQEYYDNAGLKVLMKTSNPATVEMTLLISDTYNYSQNVQYMFLAGMLNIECAGISYTYAAEDLELALIWEGYNYITGQTYAGQNTWDEGVWAI